MAPISKTKGDEIARLVFNCMCKALDESCRTKKLQHIMETGCNFEKWVVFETCDAIYHSQYYKKHLSKHWDCLPEIVLPGQKRARKHIDLFMGCFEKFTSTSNEEYDQPCSSTPVFEFKMLRDDDWNDGISSINKDISKLNSKKAKLLNKYLVVLYNLKNDEKEMITPKCLFDYIGARLLEPISNKHWKIKLDRWPKEEIAIFAANIFRIK